MTDREFLLELKKGMAILFCGHWKLEHEDNMALLRLQRKLNILLDEEEAKSKEV
jgi:hypothetical protein